MHTCLNLLTHCSVVNLKNNRFQMLGKLADASSEPEHALVVTHGAWLMCMMDYLADSRNTHYDIEEFQDKWLKNGPPNTATTRFLIHPFKNGNANEKSKRKLQIVHVYDTTHLPEHFKN